MAWAFPMAGRRSRSATTLIVTYNTIILRSAEITSAELLLSYPVSTFFTIFVIHKTAMGIADNIASLTKEIPHHVKIIAVSKTMPVPVILEAYHAGQRAFGENRVQELLQKQPQLPPDIEWHLIGHLQSNKVKSIIPVVSLIQSVDSLKLIVEINKEASKINKVMDCLLQIRIADEETKFGLTAEDAVFLLESKEYRILKNVRIKGLMGIATFTDDIEQIRGEFRQLEAHFRMIRERFFALDHSFRELSIGMSGDYKQAIEAGSTMVRIGTLIFGSRSLSP